MNEKISKILHLYKELTDKDKQEIENNINYLSHYWDNCNPSNKEKFLTFEEQIENCIEIRKCKLNGLFPQGGLPECHNYFPCLPNQEIKSAVHFVSLNFALSNDLFDSSELDNPNISRIFQALTLQLALQEICDSFSQENFQTYRHLLQEGNKILYSKADKNQSLKDSPKTSTAQEN